MSLPDSTPRGDGTAGRPEDPETLEKDEPRLPTTEDMIAGIAGELRRHARVLRRVVERALEPRVPEKYSEEEGMDPGARARPSAEGAPPKLGDERDDCR